MVFIHAVESFDSYFKLLVYIIKRFRGQVSCMWKKEIWGRRLGLILDWQLVHSIYTGTGM